MRTVSLLVVGALIASLCILPGCDGEEDVSPPARGEADTATPDTAEAPVTPKMESGDVAGEGAPVDMQLQTSMNEYVSNLSETNEILSDVDNAVEAAAASPKLAPIVDQLKGFKAKWDGMDPQTKEQLKSAFRDQLQPVVNQLNEQIQRIQNDPAIADSLKALVGEIPVIEI